MDTVWIDSQVSVVCQGLGLVRAPKWALFEPTPSFYAGLKTGSDKQLAHAAGSICAHLGLAPAPQVSYELGLRMHPEAAGEIRSSNGSASQIRIPLSVVGKPLALGAVLAHELTHEFIRLRAPSWRVEEQYEQITDITSIALGLGKLVLNGMSGEVNISAPEVEVLGYISPESKVYAYQKVNALHSVSDAIWRRNLTEEAAGMLAPVKSNE